MRVNEGEGVYIKFIDGHSRCHFYVHSSFNKI